LFINTQVIIAKLNDLKIQGPDVLYFITYEGVIYVMVFEEMRVAGLQKEDL